MDRGRRYIISPKSEGNSADKTPVDDWMDGFSTWEFEEKEGIWSKLRTEMTLAEELESSCSMPFISCFG